MRALITGSLSSFINYILIYLVGMLISRLLGASSYGQIAYAIAIATIMSYFFSFGLPKVALQLIPKYSIRKQDQKLKGLISGGLFYIITISIIISFATFFIYKLIAPFLYGLQFKDFSLIMTLSATIAITRFLAYCLEGRGQFVLGSFVYKIIAPIIWIVFISIIYFVGFIPFSIDPILQAYSYAWAIGAFIALALVLYYFSNRIWQVKPRYNWKKWLKFGAAYATNSFSLIVINQVGLIVLGTLPGDKAITGIYAAILNIVSFLYLMLTASNGYFLPLIARAHAEKSLDKVNKILRLRFKYLGLISLGFIVFIVLLGEVLLGLYGSVFAQYDLPLIILSVIYMFETLLGTSVNIIVIYGHQTRAATSQVVAAATAIILTLLFTPHMGIYGPILAYLLTKMLAAIANSIWLYRRYRIKVLPFKI